MKPLLATVSVPFAPRGGLTSEQSRAYADALVCDIEAAAPEMSSYEVQAVRVVGECPQLMAAADLGRVLHALEGCFAVAADREVVVDVMPGRLTAGDLSLYRDAGVTALCLDVRTTQGREAKRLDRACDVGDSLATVLLLQREGFESYGVRLGCGFAEQTEDSLADRGLVSPYAERRVLHGARLCVSGSGGGGRATDVERRRTGGHACLWRPFFARIRIRTSD